MVERVRNVVERNPEKTAVVDGSRRISYGALWAEIERVAGFLQTSGLRKGDRAAIWLENSYEYIAAYYGIQLGGGVVVPLNPAARSKEIVRALTHSNTGWLFTSGRNAELKKVEESLPRVTVVCIAEDGGNSAGSSVRVPWSALERVSPQVRKLTSNDFASIVYTSGTTGRPKGVLLSHGNISCNVTSILDYLALQPDDRIVNVLPFFYSYGNSVLQTHLAVGGTVILENSLVYPHRVVERVVSEKATGFSGVPSTFILLLRRVRLMEYDLSQLRYVTQAGGPLAPASIQQFCDAVPGCQFFVMYGQTEATARIAYLPPERLAEKTGSAGIAIPGVEIQIRSESGGICSVGEVGEIYVRGRNVMQGYWDDPAATGEVMQEGWLRTGDLAYVDEEGFLFIQGRNAEMIKVGANRINPLEIEEILCEIPGVAEAAVVGIPDEILGETIRAVVRPALGATLDRKAILAHCRDRLPLFKLPKQVDFVEELPRTASGKLQRRALAVSLSSDRQDAKLQ